MDKIKINNETNNVKKDIDELCSISYWTREQEELLSEWSEKAQCYRWLHGNAERHYKKGHFFLTVPIIIMSTLTGTANFAVSSYVPEKHVSNASLIIGGINIFSGILSTLQNFLRYAENNESHRSAGILWSKFGRNIRIELSLDRTRRKSASDFLKIYRSEYDRLIEQSPLIPKDTIKKFRKKFKNEYKDKKIHVPDVCNGLEKCPIYQTDFKEEKECPIYKTDLKKEQISKNIVNDITKINENL